MADIAAYSKWRVLGVTSNISLFDSVKAPHNEAGRPRSINTSYTGSPLRDLIEEPKLYQDKMAIFLWDELDF